VTHRDYPIARERMVREQLIPNGISDPRVLDVMSRIPRHAFLGGDMGPEAYGDHSFPIGFSQTMSQPFMVAYLAESLALVGDETILEIGTGSGYQAAVLSRLAKRIYTIERIEPLAEKAQKVLRRLGIDNVEISVGDGSHGWPERGPFDRILATAAAGEVPHSLLEQMREGGFFLGPVFNGAGEQEIVRLTRAGRDFRLERLRPCAFVPLIRKTHQKADRGQAGESGRRRRPSEDSC
jgi:protein-L-isoaspartate(D-aspartate) O-methyltransferase